MLHFGVDYYPEQWPESRWETDARLMQEAQFNTVRLAEFAWARLEPRNGEYDFAWLDRAIEVLASRGMQVVLGTPSASPPSWLMARDPTIYRVQPDGLRASYGARREYCPSHPGYRGYVARLVEAMARHYTDHPAVIGWQIDNEFGGRCFCAHCLTAFHTWLQTRYTTLDALNAAWGTVFWSHSYADWQHIPAPLETGGPHNPGLALAYARCQSDSYAAFQHEQLAILRNICPNDWTCHNFMGFGFEQLNYFDLARDLDLVAWDNYQRHQWNMDEPPNPVGAALAHATMRGLKQQPFWVIEQQAGSSGWDIVGEPPRPGELRLWAYQAIAHGADGVVFFRWRTARHGTEQYWHGLLDHDATPGRCYAEIKRMGHELTRFGAAIVGSNLPAEVAMLLSYDARFALQIQPNNPQLGYRRVFEQIYQSLYSQHAAVDIVAPDADLSRYKLVIAPMLHVLTEPIAANLAHYVANGGVLVTTFRSGVKDADNTVVDCRLPGLLAAVCGIEVEEYVSLGRNTHNQLTLTNGLANESAVELEAWCDVLLPRGAAVVARYRADFFADKPAITHHRYGAGQAIYIGTTGETLYAVLMPWLLSLAQVQPMLQAPSGVEVSVRQSGQQAVLFLLNHSDEPQYIKLAGVYRELVHSEIVAQSMLLAPKDVAILVCAEEHIP